MTKSLGVLILMAIMSSGSGAQTGSILSLSKDASGLPPFTVPECLGVNIHFTGPETEQVAKIADEGFRFIRMDFEWTRVEKKKGEYDFKAYDELVDSLASKGIRAYFILDYGNPLYDNDMAPHTDEGRAAFGRFAAAGAAHFKGKNVIWELWNEPNIFFWRPTPNVEDYVKLAKVVYPALKKADPNCTVLAPTTSGVDLDYLEKAFKVGLLENTDVVSVHPYGAGKPEDAAPLYAKLRELISRYAPKGKQFDLVSGEWGYSTFSKGVSEETQADFVARQFLSNMMNHCRISIWYDWRDDGPDPNENEHRFGTVRQDMKEKPAFFAAKTLTTELAGYSYANRIRIGGSEDYLAIFKKGDDYRLAAWTTGDPHTISLPVDFDEAEIVSRSGERGKAAIKDGKLELKLTHSPHYVEPIGKSARWAAEAAWTVNAIAQMTEKGLELRVNSVNDTATEGEIGVDGAGVDKMSVKFGGSAAPGVITSYNYTGKSNPVVTVTLRPKGLKEPLVRVVELDTSACPRVEVLPSAGSDILISVQRPLAASSDELKGSVTLLNPQGIRFEKNSIPVTLAPGQERALLHVAAQAQPAAMFSFACRLVDPDGKPIVTMAAKRYSMVESFADGKTGEIVLKYRVDLDGDPKVAAEAKLTYAKSPAGAPTPVCARLDYSFGDGWRFVRVAQGLPIPIAENPAYVRIWVKGDGGRGSGRLRIKDTGDQTFQADFGALDFTDWRCIQADMTSTASHWGGSDNGKIGYPIKWDTLFLLDNVGGGASKGQVYLGPVMLYYE